MSEGPKGTGGPGHPLNSGIFVELPRVIEQAIDESAIHVGRKPVAVVAEYPAHLPSIEGDPDELAGIVGALLSDVLSFMDQGEIKIRAELLPAGESPEIDGEARGNPETLAEGGPWAIVRFAFNGGPAAEQGFSAVLQGESDLKLAGERSRLEARGGRMWFEAGTSSIQRVGFALPLHAVHVFREGAAAQSVRRAVAARLPDHGEDPKGILVLADQAEVRSLLTEELAQAGYRVIVAESGDEVLGLARSERPDLVLLDLLARMPTALDVAMILKQDRATRGIPILFLTSIDDAQGGTQMGAVNFLVRPEGTGALITAVNALLTSGLSTATRVLVVESDDTVREGMVMMIQAHGYRVTVASAPEEAMALAERVAPGMVLVNADMAQERDYWLLRGLRQLSTSMEIYVLADSVDEAQARVALTRGASGYSNTGRLQDLLRKAREDPPQNNA